MDGTKGDRTLAPVHYSEGRKVLRKCILIMLAIMCIYTKDKNKQLTLIQSELEQLQKNVVDISK